MGVTTGQRPPPKQKLSGLLNARGTRRPRPGQSRLPPRPAPSSGSSPGCSGLHTTLPAPGLTVQPPSPPGSQAQSWAKPPPICSSLPPSLFASSVCSPKLKSNKVAFRSPAPLRRETTWLVHVVKSHPRDPHEPCPTPPPPAVIPNLFCLGQTDSTSAQGEGEEGQGRPSSLRRRRGHWKPGAPGGGQQLRGPPRLVRAGRQDAEKERR